MGIEITKTLRQLLDDQKREFDGKLHASGLAHCEYGQIQEAMGEVKEAELDTIDLVVMHTGTMWHRFLQEDDGWLCAEMDVSDYMPDGWSGTIDGLKAMDELYVRALIDVKTMNGEGMRYIKGVKPEHRWQVSAYYWAVDRWYKENKSNIRLHPKALIYYLPVSRAKDYVAEPVEVWFEPLQKDVVIAEMEKRSANLEHYKKYGENLGDHMPLNVSKKRAAGGFTNIYIAPNWWVNYCPAKDCPCSKVKSKRIGHMDPGGNITSVDPAYPADAIYQMLHPED